MKGSDLIILPAMALLLLAIYFYHQHYGHEPKPPPTPQPIAQPKPNPRPDFRAYKSVQQKKYDFFAYLLPMIRESNDTILQRRNWLKGLTPEALENAEIQAEINHLWRRYRVPGKPDFQGNVQEKLLLHIDQVPAALILAQAANESAWGTSRFAREANNFFGLWCFSKGCGLKPQQREEGLHHEVEKFATVADGVKRYIFNLNSHPAYKSLREIRANLRDEQQALNGSDLAAGLLLYSERGQAYVEEVQAMIRFNKLESLNRREELATKDRELR